MNCAKTSFSSFLVISAILIGLFSGCGAGTVSVSAPPDSASAVISKAPESEPASEPESAETDSAAASIQSVPEEEIVIPLPELAPPFSAAAPEETGESGGFGGAVDKSSDAELQSMINELVPKFQVLTYEDEEIGRTLDFNLFIPEDYNGAEQYPMVLFMGDSTTTGRGAEYQLTQGWGGLIWAAEEEQEKHPCFVVVPVITETLVDDSWYTSPEVDMIAHLIPALEDFYSIDRDRVYTTGQSGGCMASMYLNITYPELFASSLYVSGQWDAEAMRAIEETSFFYVTAEGDEKASAGKASFEAVLDEDQVPYVSTVLNAQDDSTAWDAAVAQLLSQNCSKNMVQWEKGSVQGGDSSGGSVSEHMSSFDYAYQVPAIRDWLFTQTR